MTGYEAKIEATIRLWMEQEVITRNAYGVAVYELVEEPLGDSWKQVYVIMVDIDPAERKHTPEWYVQNAEGKKLICEMTGMNSKDALELVPEVVVTIEGAFPWPGAVISSSGKRIVATSGGSGLEDVKISDYVQSLFTTRERDEALKVIEAVRARGKAYSGADDDEAAMVRFIGD